MTDTRDRSKNFLMLTAVCGFLFSGANAVARLINLCVTGGEAVIPEHKLYVFANAALFILSGITIILFQKKTQLFNYIWLLAYALGAGIFWDREYRLMLPQLIMLGVLLFIAVTGSINPKHNFSAIAGRIMWLAVLVAQIVMFFVLFTNTTISMSADMYITAWMLAILITLSETIPFLKMHRKLTVLMAIAAFLLLSTYLFAPGALIAAEETFTLLMYYFIGLMQGIAVLYYALWLHTGDYNSKRVGTGKSIITTLAAAALGLVFTLTFWTVYARDIGVRKQQAEIAYHEIYSWGEYNWGEIDGYDCYVETQFMEYSIVDLNDGNMPVLFLHTTQPPAAEGFSRVVFYDEETGTPYQVMGSGMNCIGVVGYIPCDENHEYPIIIFNGERQDVIFEFIYEVRDQQMILIGEKFDLPFHESDAIDTDITHNPDEYYWNGEPVTIDQYKQNRESIISGYTEITWYKGA